MPFKSTIRIPSEVLEAIVSLSELTAAFAVQSATQAGRADAYGDPQLAQVDLDELAKGAPLAAVRP